MTQNEFAIHQLKSLNLEVASIEEVQKWAKCIQIPIVATEIIEGTYICRARRGKGYIRWEDVNYRPAKDCTNLQRASLPGKTVLYGVISDDQHHLENARAIGVAECSKLAASGKDSVGKEYISNSQWIVKQPIQTACIVSKDSYNGVENNVLLNVIKSDFIAKFGGNQEAINLASFVEGEFSKIVKPSCDYEYKISAVISDLLLNTYDFDAIAYPSVKMGGQVGLNIAIRPDTVDSKLVLDNIADQCYYKNGEEGIVEIERVFYVTQQCYWEENQISKEIIAEKIGLKTLADFPLIN